MSNSHDNTAPILRKTPLHAAHVDLGARMVSFAGYDMPVQYPTGILEEHTWTRNNASLFDISHMGQALVIAHDGRHETAAAALEALVPADILNLAPGQQRYTQLLNATGGIIDDLMVTRPTESAIAAGTLMLVINAARKDIDCAHIAKYLAASSRLEPLPERALLALQGPKSGDVLGALCPESRALLFMQATRAKIASYECYISRSGYTGEDGFEISVAAKDAAGLWQTLLASDAVRPCGLGARDSLRLEAGLCLYGHELDDTTSPVEAGLVWSIQKRRRIDGGYLGAERVAKELASAPARVRVGILPAGRPPARDGTEILSENGEQIGIVTSGGYAPTLKRPIAMGYVPPLYAEPTTSVRLRVRGALLDARVVTLPFVPHSYRRSA